MSTQRYSVTPHSINTLLAWVQSGAVAIPEIQRPFVWEATKVRNLLDSLYQGFPVGYLIAWQNPSIRLKDGTSAAGKQILIDGQQRITALMAAVLGHDVLNKDYETVSIRIAFHPQVERFEVTNPAIQKDAAWIPDVARIFAPGAKLLQIMRQYTVANPDCDEDAIAEAIQRLAGIIHNQIGVINLADDLDIETVTEIFIRVNSAGTALSQADFAMSKIAVNETYGGNLLRKAIDYFCHLAVAPDFIGKIERGDKAFAASEFFPQMRWLRDVNDDIYDPTYTDMLRVAFTSEFGRGRLQDLVALLSGRNFETKQYEEVIAEASFDKLKHGIRQYINQTHFERLTMILRSAGFVTSDLIGGRNAVNFAYIVYLRGRQEQVPAANLERMVRRWYALATLRGRYSGNPETSFDFDIRQIESRGLVPFIDAVVENELPDSFWTGMLPQLLDTSSSISPYFLAFKAAQVKLGDKGFLSRDISVRDLVLNRGDAHHVYPRNHLKGYGLASGRYNQIANYAITQSEINIAIGDKAPQVYFEQLGEQCMGGPMLYGALTDRDEMAANFRMNCVPESLLDGVVPEYDEFLAERRKLMALRIKAWFEAL